MSDGVRRWVMFDDLEEMLEWRELSGLGGDVFQVSVVERLDVEKVVVGYYSRPIREAGSGVEVYGE